MEVARLVGLEQREYYGRDGSLKRYVGLHFCYLEDSSAGVIGSKVEVVSCPRDVSSGSLKIGTLYELEYQLFNTRNGKAARLVGLTAVSEK